MSKISIQFLGSGDAFASGSRFQTCIYVDTGSGAFLLDCGASSLIALKKYGISSSKIDSILISHLHGDHFGGIPFFLLDAKYVSKRSRRLLITGPPGLEARLQAAREVLFPTTAEMELNFPLQFAEYEEGSSMSSDKLVVTPFPVAHPSGAQAFALRVQVGGKVIAFSGDTGWTDNLIEVSRGADLFICEASNFDKKTEGHLDYMTIMSRRKELECKRLVLTHMGEEMLERAESIEIECAEDGKRMVI